MAKYLTNNLVFWSHWASFPTFYLVCVCRHRRRKFSNEKTFFLAQRSHFPFFSFSRHLRLFVQQFFGALGSGIVDSAVASDTRGPGFESSHRQQLLNMFTVNCLQKRRKLQKKRPGMSHLKLKKQFLGPNPASFDLFSFFSHDKYSTNPISFYLFPFYGTICWMDIDLL